jgi:hypothetical protein
VVLRRRRRNGRRAGRRRGMADDGVMSDDGREEN